MIIQFKSAPELGRLKVVSTNHKNKNAAEVCNQCVLFADKYMDVCSKTPCYSLDGKPIHFEQVKPNEN